MRQFLANIIYQEDGALFNVLAHIFFYITFAFGFFFVVLSDTDSVQNSVLFQEGNQIFTSLTVSVWGICAMIVTVFNTIARGFGKERLGVWAAMGGFLLWLFAGIVYMQDWQVFQFAVGALPNMLFWIWYYINVKGNQRSRSLS